MTCSRFTVPPSPQPTPLTSNDIMAPGALIQTLHGHFIDIIKLLSSSLPTIKNNKSKMLIETCK